MEKVLISLPHQLAARLRAAIPTRQRSKIITHLIEEEVKRRERALYECALAVENDNDLRQEMKDWDVTLFDGLNEAHKPLRKSNKPKKAKSTKK